MLCSIAIIKNGDKNLVDGRTQFNVKSEILSLDFRVDLKSSYIFKSCLGKLKKRRALLSNLRDVNASLRQIYSSSSNGASSEESDTRMTTKTCSRAPFESDVQPAKRVALQDGRSPERPQACGRIPLMTSTPYRKQGGQGIDSPTVAVSQIAQSIDRELPINDETCEDQNVNTKTSVQVRVEWASKTKVNNLHECLESHTHLFLAKLLLNIRLNFRIPGHLFTCH